MSINILITAVGGDIGSNIVNILQNNTVTTFNIFGTDINKNIFQPSRLIKFIQVKRTTHKNYAKKIIEIIKDEKIDVLIPVSENEILWFNDNISLFKNLKVKILINNPILIKKFLNKLTTAKSLKKLGIHTPKTYSCHTYKNQLKFPIIIKAKQSITSKAIYIINNKSELKHILVSLNSPDKYIIQKYMGSMNEEYTTTVYRNANMTKVITFKRQLSGSMTSFASIKKEKILQIYAKKIANEFNLHGTINIQSRKVDNKYYIFEINPRFSSTIFIRNYFHFTDLLWWISDAMNVNLIPKNKKIKKSGKAILGYTYSFIDFKDINEN